MKFFLLIAIVAVIAVVFLAMRGSGAGVTTIERRHESEEDDDA